MKKMLSGVLVMALTMTVPMSAAEKPSDTAKATETAAPIAGALKGVGQTVTPHVETRAAASSKVPLSLPRNGVRSRKGVGMMVTTLVSTAAGAAASIYMIKQMQKNTEQK